MKKYIATLIGFISFSTFSYFLLIGISGLFFPQWMKPNIYYRIGGNGHMYSRMKEARKTGNVDLLFLGSSHTYRGFDPRCFKKYKTFNLGSSGQTPVQTKLLMSRFLNTLKPQTIIYEVYPITFSLDGVESSLDIISNDRNDFNSIEMAININHIKTYNTLIYGFFRDLLHLNKNFSEASEIDTDTYIPGGYVQREMGYFKYENITDRKRHQLRQNQLEAFKDIVNLINMKGIRLILVQAPIPSKFYNSYIDNPYFDSIMTSYKLPYYNFNKILSLNDSLHFYDSSHLNQIGVELFNNKLKEVIEL